VLRITDARSGEPLGLPRGLIRVHVHPEGEDTTALRLLLVADVLARALDLGGSPCLTVARVGPKLRARADALGIRRAEPEAPPGGRVLHVRGTGRPAPEDGPHLEVAPAADPPEPADPAGPSGPSEQSGPPGPSGVPDPTALRLALLARPRLLPAAPDAVALAEAARTLARWRRSVAGWAEHPSRPVPDDVRGRLRAAWEDDLDLPAALDVLRGLEDGEAGEAGRGNGALPPGARFESYAYADRLLGLELTREIGTRY
jgi:hypothetical protein